MKWTKAAALSAAVIGGADAASATTFFYEFTATCEFNCAAVGLGENDSIVGFLEITTLLFAPNQFFESGSLGQLSIAFGSTTISRDTAFGASLGGFWGSAPTYFGAIDLRAGMTGVPATGAVASIGLGGGSLSLDSACSDATCSEISGGTQAMLSPAAFRLQAEDGVVRPPAPIPLPPAALLLVGGIAAIGLVRSRRRPC